MSDDGGQFRSTIDVMHAHTSCRQFTEEPVSDDVLESLIEAGTRASTSSNMQAYTIISIDDDVLKRDLAKHCADQTQIHQSGAFLVFCADLHRLKLCAQMHGAESVDYGVTEGLVLSLVDTALVMENVAVAAESLGLGICMIGAMRNHPADVKELLFLPKHVFAVAGMCIGWPADRSEPKPRLPLDAIWHRNRYRSDGELLSLIEAYDGIMSAFYEREGMHTRDSRWTAVMSKRIGGVAKRTDVGRVLREQGFDTRGD